MSDRTPVPKKQLSLPLKNISNNITFGESPSTCIVNSPMTNLAFNLSGLSTGRGTPKRKLSLSCIDTPTSEEPTPERMSSTESGCYMESPTLEALTTFDQRKKTIAFRRINSLPLPSLHLDSPTDFIEKEISLSAHDADISPIERPTFDLDDTCSQDSGLGLDREKDEVFMFKAPSAVPRRKMKIINEDTCSPLKYSPVKSPSKKRPFSVSFSRESPEEKTQLLFGSPVRLRSSPLTSMEDDVDDGFLDVYDPELSYDKSVSSSMTNLFCAPLINKSVQETDNDTPILRRKCSRSLLYRSQSLDVRPRTKRSPRDENTPVSNKRHRFGDSDENTYSENSMPVIRKFQRCHSETEAMIKSAVNKMSDNVDLIGDCSKPYSLPSFTSGKHQGLTCISSKTVCRLINNEFDDVESYRIIDCRYPYEYNGGHIKNGENIYTKDVILEEILKKRKVTENPDKRHVIVFHCEFSSERGPNLLRFLRNKDRDANKDDYPFLYYPELYLLHGGYKHFYENHKEYCEPQTYLQMSDKDYLDDLKKFRAKSKSWNGDKSRSVLRPLKF